jgi:hypothetical protein
LRSPGPYGSLSCSLKVQIEKLDAIKSLAIL